MLCSFQVQMEPVEMTPCSRDHTRASACRPPNANQAWKCSSYTWRRHRCAANRDFRSNTWYYVLPAFKSPAHTIAVTHWVGAVAQCAANINTVVHHVLRIAFMPSFIEMHTCYSTSRQDIFPSASRRRCRTGLVQAQATSLRTRTC
jgi:hypothetical protein